VQLNGVCLQALLDTGSGADLMLSTTANLVKIKHAQLDKLLMVQLAVQGLKTKVNYAGIAMLQYGNICCKQQFDIANINGYDLILGTPFIFQHKIMIRLNPTTVVVQSDAPLPIKGESVCVLTTHVMDLFEDQMEKVCQEMRNYAALLCKKANEMTLPPLQKTNHWIPIIDLSKWYSFCPSRCPEAFCQLWNDKCNVYIGSGHWRYATSSNAVPLMFLKKHTVPGEPIKMRNTIDLQEHNANTQKLASPLPDQQAILYQVSSHKYVSCIDGQDTYEQFCVEPEDIKHTLMITPDGTIESLVMQQGDCNAVAMFMNVMTDMFSQYLGVWMDVYLDDIVIYLDSLEDHVCCVKIVIDTFTCEQFYLAPHKLQFLPKELKLLGHIITCAGIRMDPAKIDSVMKWPVPTDKMQTAGFIGTVSYLVDNIEAMQIPMHVLNCVSGSTVAFQWGLLEQHAFDLVKCLTHDHSEKVCTPMEYGPDSPMAHLLSDSCNSGIAGCICQDKDWQTVRVIVFFSAKLSPAQQNYTVTEIEMLAGLETMMHH
jgi:hypothetical protein